MLFVRDKTTEKKKLLKSVGLPGLPCHVTFDFFFIFLD
jgi:hypothetical protein